MLSIQISSQSEYLRVWTANEVNISSLYQYCKYEKNTICAPETKDLFKICANKKINIILKSGKGQIAFKNDRF